MTWVLLVLAAVAAAAVAWGWFEAGWLRRRVVELELDGVPPELDGLRIAHLSDFHLGVPSRGRRATEDAIAWVVARRPDLVCVTGDLVSRRAGIALLERLLGELGESYVVLGNHDLADSRDPFSQHVDPSAFARVGGATVLGDESVGIERRGRRIQLVGVDPRTYARREAEPAEQTELPREAARRDADTPPRARRCAPSAPHPPGGSCTWRRRSG